MLKLRTKTAAGLQMVKSILSDKGYKSNDIKPTEIEVLDVREDELRLVLQKELDERGFKFSSDFVLINGNSVWSLKKIKKEVNSIKRNGSKGISKYFYDFMHLNFTIAHYNIHGWIEQYPTWNEVKATTKNSFCPAWKADVQTILVECFV